MNIPVLMYHEINTKDKLPVLKKYIQRNYLIDSLIFENQLSFLHYREYTSVVISKLSQIPNKTTQKFVALTFDDGYIGNYLCVFPLVKKNNFKATFFITTDWVNEPNMLNWEQIREMSDYGMEIGSHTCSHALLGTEKEELIYYELGQSKECIEKKIKKTVTSVSYPNGSYNSKVNRIAKILGYTTACASDCGYWNLTKNNFIVPRFAAPAEIKLFEKIISLNFPYTLKEKTLDKAKLALKYVLGRKLYNDLYMKIFNLEVIKKQ